MQQNHKISGLKSFVTKSSLLLRGERIYLRCVRESDVNDIYCRWMNDSEVNKYLESRYEIHTVESLIKYVTEKIDSDEELFLGIFLNGTDRHIGNIKVGPINWHHRYGDIGVIIGEQDCWGMGYATEAIELLSSFCFNSVGLNKLTAGCYSTNVGSERAFQKAGFVKEGLRKRHCLSDGEYVDGILLGKLNPKDDYI